MKEMKKINSIALYHNDCLKKMNELIEMGYRVDMVLTDPPYGINYRSNHRKERYDKIQNDTESCLLLFLDEYFNKCFNLMKDNTHIYVFCSWHNVDVFKQSFENYFKLKNIIVWEKNAHGTGDLKGSYAPKHEFILFGHKGRKIRNGKRIPDIIKADRTGNRLHPTQKPVELLEIFIQQSSNEYDIVFDGFMGSGSTGVACVNTNRRFIGIELDENYFNIAKKRIEEKCQNVEFAIKCQKEKKCC